MMVTGKPFDCLTSIRGREYHLFAMRGIDSVLDGKKTARKFRGVKPASPGSGLIQREEEK
jgi:hypothetical protein